MCIRDRDNGYLTERVIYECEDCSGCHLKEKCTKSKGNRRSTVSKRLQKLREEAAHNLRSEKGIRLRSKRPVEVETVFGRLKHNWSFRRFTLRGIKKVKTEWGLLLSLIHIWGCPKRAPFFHFLLYKSDWKYARMVV